MFSKPFSLISVYILTVINFSILLLPLLIAAFPFVDFDKGRFIVSAQIVDRVKFSVVFLVFVVSFLMLLYLFLDFIFGFTCKASLKGAKNFEELSTYKFLGEIFSQVRNKFFAHKVALYIRDNTEINAFAVASTGRRAIVLTSGLIDHYLTNSADRQEFLRSIRSIMGHEMSHLINKDFIPGLLIMVNQKVTNLVSGILHQLLKLFLKILVILRINGRYTNNALIIIYELADGTLTFFNRCVVYNLYEFLRKYIGRTVEYRCDKQSAQAFSGYNMALALAYLGEKGYFTLFSTHPSTKKRIKKVKDIQETGKVIRPLLSSSIANYFSWMILVIICLICAKASKVDLIIRKYLIEDHRIIYQYLKYIYNTVKNVIQ